MVIVNFYLFRGTASSAADHNYLAGYPEEYSREILSYAPPFFG